MTEEAKWAAEQILHEQFEENKNQSPQGFEHRTVQPK
jgi:hypothetical protein